MKDKKIAVYYACIFLLSYSILIFFNAEIVIYITQEDGLYEWIGAFSLLASSIIFLLLFVNNKKSKVSLYYLIFTLMFLFGFLEEINWGQRIFNIQVPETLKEVGGHQLSIHNIPLADHYKNGDRRLLGFVRLISIFWLLYLFVLPVANKYLVYARNIIKTYEIPISPIWIGLFYILNHLLNTICLYYYKNVGQQGIVEIKEFNLEILLLLMSLSIYMANVQAKETSINNSGTD